MENQTPDRSGLPEAARGRRRSEVRLSFCRARYARGRGVDPLREDRRRRED